MPIKEDRSSRIIRNTVASKKLLKSRDHRDFELLDRHTTKYALSKSLELRP